jgi:putative ABC transport system permease protein
MLMRSFSLAVRSLLARPLRTLLTTFGVVLGVAVILAISISNGSTMEAVADVFAQASGKAHLSVNNANTRDRGFTGSVLRQVEGVDGVQAAVPVLLGQALLGGEELAGGMAVSMLGTSSGGLIVYGVDPALDTQAREYKVVEGSFLSPELDRYEILLVKDYADEKEIRVGNEIELATGGGAATPDGAVTLKVVGLISKEGPGLLGNGAFAAIPLETARQIFARANQLDQVDVVAVPEASQGKALEDLKVRLQARLGSEYSVIYPATQGEKVSQMLAGYQMGLGMFSAIAIFVGAFLIYNAFSMTVIERTREIGMLRTLGMTRGQVLRQILIEAGLLGIVGSLLGLAAGVGLAIGLIKAMEIMVSQEVREVQVPPGALAASFAVGLLVTLAAAAIPAFQASRVSPLEALRVRGRGRDGWFARRGWIVGLALIALSLLMVGVRLPPPMGDHTQDMAVMGLLLGGTLVVPSLVGVWERAARPLTRRIYGEEGALGSRNVQRARLRTALTVAALMVGVAMILSIRAVSDAFGQDISNWLQRYIGGDLYVHSTLNMRSELGNQLASIEGVQAVAPVRYLDIKNIKPEGGYENLSLMAVDPESYSQVTSFVFTSGQGDPQPMIDRLDAGDAVFLSSVLSEKYGLQRGDRLRLLTRRGEREFEVAGVVVDFYNQGRVLQTGWNDLRRYWGFNDASTFLIKLYPDRSPDAVRDRIKSLYGSSYHLTVDSNQAMRANAIAMIGQTTGMFDVLAMIAMIVAALGVVNTLTMNVVERTREIGMLRSLGMTRRQVSKMILAEAGLMGAIGGLMGLALGLLMSRTILASINSMAGFSLTYVFSLEGIVVGLVLAFVVSQLAALWPARRASRLRVIEAIQFE